MEVIHRLIKQDQMHWDSAIMTRWDHVSKFHIKYIVNLGKGKLSRDTNREKLLLEKYEEANVASKTISLIFY